MVVKKFGSCLVFTVQRIWVCAVCDGELSVVSSPSALGQIAWVLYGQASRAISMG
jgi:hypothetical protein